MTWREEPAGPVDPTMMALVEPELDLIVRCSRCPREWRLTPMAYRAAVPSLEDA